MIREFSYWILGITFVVVALIPVGGLLFLEPEEEVNKVILPEDFKLLCEVKNKKVWRHHTQYLKNKNTGCVFGFF